MAERDRTAVHVHLLRVEAELADHEEALRRERLVQLHEVDLLERDTGPVEQLPHGRDRADAHHARVDAGNRAADERAERLHAELAGLLLRGDHERCRPVLDPGGVAGGDGASLTEGGLERGEFLGGGVWPRMLVARDVADRNELVRETARLVGCGPAALRLQRERVLILPRHAPTLRDVLAGLAHRLRREELDELRIRDTPTE